jgi:copper chaperone CopZ
MSQSKLQKVVFKVDGLFTSGHARRCEAMIRNSAGGIVSVKANEIMGTVEIVFDTHILNQHSIRDIVDDTGYTVIN